MAYPDSNLGNNAQINNRNIVQGQFANFMSNKQANPQMSPVVPLDPTTGQAYLVGYEDPTLNAANQDILGLQGGMTEQMAVDSTTSDTGMGAMGMLNFGLGAAQTLAGIHYQNKALDKQQQSLDLAKDKYTDLRGDRAELQRVNKERSALAQSQINAYKG